MITLHISMHVYFTDFTECFPYRCHWMLTLQTSKHVYFTDIKECLPYRYHWIRYQWMCSFQISINVFLTDINECAESTSGCDSVNGVCTDVPGFYQCSCKPGFVLFTSNGTASKSIPPLEDGKRLGDVYYLNHTCVRKYWCLLNQSCDR